MRILRALAACLVLAGVVAGTWLLSAHIDRALCEDAKQDHAIAVRASEICTTGLVGCSLSLDQIEAVLRKEVRAKQVCR